MENEDYAVSLERHEQMIKSIQHQLNELKAVSAEIKQMNAALIEMTNEIKHTNASLLSCEIKINDLQKIPASRFEKLIGAVISALVCGIIGYIVARFFG